ncbi:hypothetical protein PFISCL1PPCAC_5647 [Pristionchus fissidentatus]|uniref:Uncharacterized protein n=1 Tax=Pristionchus fissidentatus TaxID=1538716 RepID=A0AAV5V736_9BILA|nr:hypothetical protein PFISCL1PPCAC_5647 [Pristionchus fissidentatus]
MIYRIFFVSLISASIVLSTSDVSSEIGESIDAPPQSITVDETQPAAAFQDDQPPTHVVGGANESAAGADAADAAASTPAAPAVTGHPSVTEYKFSDRNHTDSSTSAATFAAIAAVSLTILL